MQNKMGYRKISHLLFTMSLPPIFSLVINALYNIIDSIFVAMVSQESLTAVTIAFPVQLFMIAICVGTGVGDASLISRRLGEKRQAEADNAADHGLVIAFFHGIIFAILGIFLVPLYVKLFTDNPEIARQAIIYLRIVMCGSISMCISIAIERILQATGNMVGPMIFNATGSVINACLAPIFIMGFFGMPKLGVAGAGTVAIFGQFVAALIALIILLKGKQFVHINFREFKFHGKTVENIYVVGIPTMIMMSINSVMLTFMNLILISFSETAVAVMGVYFRIQTFIFMPVFGICQGALPIMGYNYGAKLKNRLLSTYKLAIIVGVIIMTLGFLFCQIFPHFFLSLFSAKGEMMEVGIFALRAISIHFIPAAFSIVTVAMFQALAHGTVAMISAILRQLVCIIPIAYIFAKTIGLNAVWFAFPIAEISSLLLSIFYFAHIYKKQIKNLDDPEVVPV